MPRYGQMSRSAQTAPVSARPRIICSPSMVFAVIWPRFSALPGKAKYQASRSGAAASDSMVPVDLLEESVRPELTLARAASEGNGASFDSGPSGLAQDEADLVATNSMLLFLSRRAWAASRRTHEFHSARICSSVAARLC